MAGKGSEADIGLKNHIFSRCGLGIKEMQKDKHICLIPGAAEESLVQVVKGQRIV